MKPPSCFGTGDALRPQQRAENGCHDCAFETACARADRLAFLLNDLRRYFVSAAEASEDGAEWDYVDRIDKATHAR